MSHSPRRDILNIPFEGCNHFSMHGEDNLKSVYNSISRLPAIIFLVDACRGSSKDFTVRKLYHNTIIIFI